jgi:DNA-binding protein HU-beta
MTKQKVRNGWPPPRNAEVVDRVASKTGLSRRDSVLAVNAMLDTVTEALAAGQSVALPGFGTFKPKERRARQGVNPRNPCEKIQIPAATVPKFSPGNRLKSSVRSY